MNRERAASWQVATLNRVPAEARIAVVTESQVAPEKEVREKFRRVKPLKEIVVGRNCYAAIPGRAAALPHQAGR